MFHSYFQLEKYKKATNRLFFTWAAQSDFSLDSDFASVCHMCFPVRKKSGRSSLALAVWNSSLSLNLHSSSSSSLLTVCLRELRSALMTHRVAPKEGRHGRAVRPLSDCFTLHSLYMFGVVPLRKEKFLRNPGVTKESAKQSKRPLKSSPTVLMLTE